MAQSVKWLGLAMILGCATTAAMGATPPTPNLTPGLNAEPGALEFGVPSAASPVPPRAAAPARTGNPLWGVPLSVLTATRERPLFSPSRRPPPPAVVNAPVTPVRAPPPPPPEHVDLVLVGTVAETSFDRGAQGIAVFLDPATRATVRLRTGEDHQGWILQAVESRAAVLRKGGQTETLALPKPATMGPVGSPPAMPMTPPPVAAPQPGGLNPVAATAGGCSPTVGC